jgi:hypothetical protein
MNDDPIFELDDRMVSAGAAVVKSIFPSATDDECGAAAFGAFMAILSEREGGRVVFSDGEQMYRFPTNRVAQ